MNSQNRYNSRLDDCFNGGTNVSKIKITADSTCDLGVALMERYDIAIQPLHITLGEEAFRDGVDITPDDIYRTYDEKQLLPQTSAPNPGEYIHFFKQWTDEGYEVIHLNLGSGISSSHQNAKLAAAELPGVYVIDSGNLSTGTGHLVIEAAELAAQHMPAAEIVQTVESLRDKVHASFVIDKLTYLREGGRCSALAAFSASVLNIRPCIEVDTKAGNMDVGKKYRGSMKKVLKKYVSDKLAGRSDIRDERIFITHSGTTDDVIEVVKEEIAAVHPFDDVFVTRAGCTISSHCGPHTVGILFMTK